MPADPSTTTARPAPAATSSTAPEITPSSRSRSWSRPIMPEGESMAAHARAPHAPYGTNRPANTPTSSPSRRSPVRCRPHPLPHESECHRTQRWRRSLRRLDRFGEGRRHDRFARTEAGVSARTYELVGAVHGERLGGVGTDVVCPPERPRRSPGGGPLPNVAPRPCRRACEAQRPTSADSPGASLSSGLARPYRQPSASGFGFPRPLASG
jgi:hypothetical protein